MKRQPSLNPAFGLRAVCATFVATLMALPVSAATSFPDYPLQTGVGSVPPNIMFILDNSGSMALISMPTTTEDFDVQPADYSGTGTGATRSGLRDDPHDRSYLNNAVYYDPGTPYLPWMTADGVTRMTGGQDVSAVYSNWNLADAAAGTRDLRGNDESIFYVPKVGVTASTNPADFDRYRVNVSGVVVGRAGTQISGFPRGPLDSSMDPYTERSFTIAVPSGAAGLEVFTIGGQNDVDLNLIGPDGVERCSSSNGWNRESCVISYPQAGNWTAQVYRDNGNNFSNVSLGAYLEVEKTPTGRSQADELKNIATWYSYFRSRMKTAKAGASEAFAGLSKNYRVGYTPINGRSDDLDVDGTGAIIPVGSNDGLFESTNKNDWFSSVHGEVVQNGSTPLRSALNDVGDYFKRTDANGPWGPQESADQLSCRQNFAILTTDGYWNDSRDSTFGMGDEDGDGHQVTLADVAAHYYETDLRDDLTDNVPGSASDTADWQHMVTFGISIGLNGTLARTDPPPASNAAVWPDPMDNENAERIDDLWHAAVNGHGNFIAAANAKAFATGLKEALGTITSRRASGSNVTSNGPQLNAGSRIFQATFTSGEWSGDVQGISIATGDIADSAAWSAAAVANAAPSDFLARGVYTWNGSDGVDFPTAAQEGALARTGGTSPVTGADNAAYLKGDRSDEIAHGGELRNRTSPIGDIVNSSPFYSEEAAALFIGANDGMLHAINSAAGTVEFSYVPAGLDFAALATLSDPEYQHRFFVDGGIDVTTRAQGNNKNILVASLGRGGKGVFALDVTDPANFDPGDDVLWDRTGAVDDDMGYVLGAPLVRKSHASGATLAFVGNGIESVNGSSTLFIYNAETGALVKEILVDATGGGLAPPRAADTNLDGVADVIYAGDLKGSLWKFDITGNTNKWVGEKFFTAVDDGGKAQPITAAVALAREPVTDRIFVLFGTGKYISAGDVTDQSTQTLYALIDAGSPISGRNALHERTIPYTGVDSLGRDARAWESYSLLPADAEGWFVDLGIPKPGERVVTAPVMRSRALWFSSIIPQAGSGCDSGGTGYLNALDAFTGTNPQIGSGTGTYIDVDGDGQGDDRLNGTTGDTEAGFITSVDLGIGMIGQATGVGGGMYACGSEAECGYVPTPPDGSGAKRLGWRELYDRN
ncbi:PilC/PilY family type IV pilus protein [Novilysobacter erysipheiresistens]|uniref:PilC/PilY family type IV pilus protein n=1 Tax=Novilysobacter erysipheiresistens TaxID=1749332 RepID=A0ABU7YTX2_9GAMM